MSGPREALVERAAAVVPSWAVLAGAGLVVAQTALAQVLPTLWYVTRQLRRARQAPEAPWFVRAGSIFAARAGVRMVVIGAGGFIWLGRALSAGLADRTGLAAALATTVVLGLIFTHQIDAVGLRRTAPWAWVRHCSSHLLMHDSHRLALVVLLLSVPAAFGIWAGLVVGVGAFLSSYLVSLKFMRRLGLVVAAPEHLRGLVSRAANQAGVASPDVVIVPSPYANAFATRGTVGFTQRAIDILDDQQLEALAAHEIAHATEPRKFVAVRVMGRLLQIVPVALAKAFAGPLMWLIAFVLGWAFQVAVQRRLIVLERQADAAATRHDAPSYCSALEALYRDNLIPPTARGAGTHPTLDERLSAAGAPPVVAPPSTPQRVDAAGGALGAAFLLTLAIQWLTPQTLRAVGGEGAADMGVVASGAHPHALLVLAKVRGRAGLTEDTIMLLRAVLAQDPGYEPARRDLVYALTSIGRCQEAEDAAASIHHPERSSEARRLVADCRAAP